MQKKLTWNPMTIATIITNTTAPNIQKCWLSHFILWHFLQLNWNRSTLGDVHWYIELCVIKLKYSPVQSMYRTMGTSVWLTNIKVNKTTCRLSTCMLFTEYLSQPIVMNGSKQTKNVNLSECVLKLMGRKELNFSTLFYWHCRFCFVLFVKS